MRYKITPHKLIFKFPFKIASSERKHTLGAYLELFSGKYTGKGEVVFPPYYPATLNGFIQFMEKIELPSPRNLIELQNYLEKTRRQHIGQEFYLAALDMALHDLLIKQKNSSIETMYQLKKDHKNTSFTIGISTNQEIKTKLKNAAPFHYLKIKVDQENIERMVKQIHLQSTKPFVVDANQGFSNRETALAWCLKLDRMDVAYLEQPFPRDDLASHEWLKVRSPIPIIADESFQTIHDFEKIKNSFDGINVKLMKCGGLYQAYKCLKKAQENKILSVIGCMSESSVANEAASQLSSLATWKDLDGPFLLKKIQHHKNEC